MEKAMNNLPSVLPETVGISSDVLLLVMKKLSELKYVNSIVILRHGRSVLEAWQAPYRRETPHQLFSLSKSFTSCAIGLAQAEGKLKITDRLISFFPEYDDCITDPRMRSVTLLDLLTMRSGHLVCATKYMSRQPDFIKAYLSSPLDTEPGICFAYNSGATYMLSAVIRQITGENVREYLIPRLFEPLRISPGIWECCPRGINLGGWGLSLTTGDLAKFAQLLLQHGKWNGRQLIPADYLAEATQKHADNSMNENPDWKLGYGYQFWISQYGYRGDGASGQLALILEKQDLCIAVTSCLNNMQELLDIFWNELIPHLHNEPLPENPEASQRLQEYTSKWKIHPPETVMPEEPTDTIFRFQSNLAGIRQCEVSFGEQCCSWTFLTDRGTEQLRAGFGHFEYSVFKLTEKFPHPAVAYAVWTNKNTLEIHSFICDGTYQDIWTVDFSAREEPLKNPLLPQVIRGEFSCEAKSPTFPGRRRASDAVIPPATQSPRQTSENEKRRQDSSCRQAEERYYIASA